MIKKCLLYSLCLVTIVPAFSQNITEKMDSLVAAYSRSGKFNGTVLVAQKETLYLRKGYGWKNKADSARNDANGIYQIGSITKQFTSALILQLQEKKKLSVQDKISKYFPGFPNGDKITIAHLLTHTSGLFNYTNDAAFMQKGAVKPVTRDSMLALFKNKPLDFEPGTKYSYSNSGYILLGYIIEKVTGRSYFQVLREQVFKPLHMDHSGFNFTALKSASKETGYFNLSDDVAVVAPVVDSTASYAAGAIYSTVDDLHAWDRALYTSKILSLSSLQQAYTPFKDKYGYGWSIDSIHGHKVVMHSGSIFGFNSLIVRDLDDQTCIVLIDNHQGRNLDKIAEALNNILKNKPYNIPEQFTEITVDTAILRTYAGEYELAPGFILTITVENGRLMTQATGQGRIPVYAKTEKVFFPKVMEATLEFVQGADGKTEKLILYQNGRVMPAKKIK